MSDPLAGHTPGPWQVANFALSIQAVGDPYGHGPMRIADVRGWGHLTGQGACRFDEAKATAIQTANARLIAAAPDLLAAAKEATISRGCNDPDCCEAARTHEAALDELCRAIAKAEGR